MKRTASRKSFESFTPMIPSSLPSRSSSLPSRGYAQSNDCIRASTRRLGILLVCSALVGCVSNQSSNLSFVKEFEENYIIDDKPVTSSWSADYSHINLCIEQRCYEGEEFYPCNPCKSISNKNFQVIYCLDKLHLLTETLQSDDRGMIFIDRKKVLPVYENNKSLSSEKSALVSDGIPKIEIWYENLLLITLEIPGPYFDRSFHMTSAESETHFSLDEEP